MEGSAVYSEYVRYREPAHFAHGLLRFFHARLLGLVAARLPPDPSILEVGYGHGFFAGVASKKGLRYQAVDSSPAVCALARSSGVEIAEAQFPDLPAQLSPFNVIWMSHVLEHAPDWPQARAMTAAAFDALPSGGLLVIIAPDVLSWKHWFWIDWSHGYPTSLIRCEQLLHDVGFSDVESRHHTATVAFAPLRCVIDGAMALIPVSFLDAFFSLLTRRRLASSFMTLLGWRQILLTARKP